jgi:hypothetical protein
VVCATPRLLAFTPCVNSSRPRAARRFRVKAATGHTSRFTPDSHRNGQGSGLQRYPRTVLHRQRRRAGRPRPGEETLRTPGGPRLAEKGSSFEPPNCRFIGKPLFYRAA